MRVHEVQVLHGRRDGGVSERARDNRYVGAGGQHVCRGCVTEAVRAHFARDACLCAQDCDHVLHGADREPRARLQPDEERGLPCFGDRAAGLDPRCEQREGIGVQRDAVAGRAFPVHVEERRADRLELRDVEPNHLVHTQCGLRQNREERDAAAPRDGVRLLGCRGEHRADLSERWNSGLVCGLTQEPDAFRGVPREEAVLYGEAEKHAQCGKVEVSGSRGSHGAGLLWAYEEGFDVCETWLCFHRQIAEREERLHDPCVRGLGSWGVVSGGEKAAKVVEVFTHMRDGSPRRVPGGRGR